MLKNWILRMTHRLWNREISRILCRAYSDRVINSQQLHELTAAFDPTQRHMVHGEHRDAGFRQLGSEPIGVAEFLAKFESDGRVDWEAAKRWVVKEVDKKHEFKAEYQSVPTFTADEVKEIKERVHRNALRSFITPEQQPEKDAE